MANDHTGFTGTWETLPSPSSMPAGDPAYQLQADPRPTSEADGDERGTKRWYRQAKETKCGEKDGKESEHLIVAVEAGERASGPRGAKGVPHLVTGAGTMARTPRPHAVSPRSTGSCEGQRIHDVTSRMRVMRTSGSVGGATRSYGWTCYDQTLGT